MLRSVLAALVFASCASAAIWPPQLGTYQRKSAESVPPSADTRLQADEYGLQETELADYGAFQVKAERFKDPTGAYAASLEPSNRLKSRLGNYLLSCDGKCPLDLASLAETALPHVSHASTPILGDYLPTRNRIPRSERYILGPAGLKASLPGDPPVGSSVSIRDRSRGRPVPASDRVPPPWPSSPTPAPRSRGNKPLNFNQLTARTSSGRVRLS